jgi:hypothetical protein
MTDIASRHSEKCREGWRGAGEREREREREREFIINETQ